MFGGQNLQPAGNQTQLDDMWILTIPSFTWIEVDQSSQSVPYARAGHTCHIWDAQMIVVGGYVGDELSCDSPGIYVYDMSTLTWVEQFTALSSSNTSAPGSASGSAPSGSVSGSAPSGSASGSASTATPDGSGSASNEQTNPFNQQPAQLANGTNPGGLEGSYGYQVPKAVVSIIGGAATGGATVTAPQVTATDGPLATGKAATYTVTQGSGGVATETSTPPGGKGGSSGGGGGANIAAIVAGTIAGLLFILACYLAFCAWLYRKQLLLYKRHVQMGHRQALAEKAPPVPGFIGSGKTSTERGSEQQSAPGTGVDDGSGSASGSGERSNWSHGGAYRNGSGTASLLRRPSSESGGSDGLIAGHEPTFLGVMLAPRRSLRVINL